MLYSGEKFRVLRDKKKKYSNSCVVRKNSERNKKPYPAPPPPPPPPPFKLNGRSLMEDEIKNKNCEKSIIKARIITGTLVLQMDRHRFNKFDISSIQYNTIYFIPIKVPQGAITNIHS